LGLGKEKEKKREKKRGRGPFFERKGDADLFLGLAIAAGVNNE
jgi:hypothetical protein